MTATDLSLASLRPDPRDESALTWFFCDAAAALGHRSSFAAFQAMLEGAQGSVPGAADEAFERRLEAATRWRKIAAVLHTLPAPQVRVLAAYYGPDGPRGAAWFGRLAGVALLTATYRDAHGDALAPLESLSLRMLTSKADERVKATATGIRREAEVLHLRAAAAYARARERSEGP